MPGSLARLAPVAPPGGARTPAAALRSAGGRVRQVFCKPHAKAAARRALFRPVGPGGGRWQNGQVSLGLTADNLTTRQDRRTLSKGPVSPGAETDRSRGPAKEGPPGITGSAMRVWLVDDGAGEPAGGLAAVLRQLQGR